LEIGLGFICYPRKTKVLICLLFIYLTLQMRCQIVSVQPNVSKFDELTNFDVIFNFIDKFNLLYKCVPSPLLDSVVGNHRMMV
jgi:hypothetical protein